MRAVEARRIVATAALADFARQDRQQASQRLAASRFSATAPAPPTRLAGVRRGMRRHMEAPDREKIERAQIVADQPDAQAPCHEMIIILATAYCTPKRGRLMGQPLGVEGIAGRPDRADRIAVGIV